MAAAGAYGRGLSQAQLFDMMDTSPETIARYERGEHEPGVAFAPRCAHVLGLRPSVWFDVAAPLMADAGLDALLAAGREALDDIATVRPAHLPAAVAALQGITRLPR